MSDETSAPEVDASPAPTVISDNSTGTFDNATMAAEAYVAALSKKEAPVEPEAPVENELSDEDNGAPETDPAVEPEANEPAEESPIDPPRSWSKEEKEAFSKLPRDVQEISARIASGREAEFRRAQNELAEQRNAVKAEREAAEQAKQQYLSKIPTIEDIQRFVQQGPFADIKNQDDADKLAEVDPFRYLQWDAYQKRLSGVAIQATQAQALKAQEKQDKRSSYEADQNKLLVELVPEMADPKKAASLRERAVNLLKDDLGLKNEQLSRWMQDDTGHEILSNAGIQKLIADGLKYRDILSAKTAVAKPNLPPVQRPGVAKPSGSSISEREQALTESFNKTGSLKVAQELYALQSSKQRRAS